MWIMNIGYVTIVIYAYTYAGCVFQGEDHYYYVIVSKCMFVARVHNEIFVLIVCNKMLMAFIQACIINLVETNVAL